MSVKEENRARARENANPASVGMLDESPPKGHEWSQRDVAEQLHTHRTVIMRMENRGELPKPRWRHRNKFGNPMRVYNADEITNIKKILDEKRAKRDAGRVYVEENQVP